MALFESTIKARVEDPAIVQVSLIRFLYVEYLLGN